MSLIERLLGRIPGQHRPYRTRPRRLVSRFGIHTAQFESPEDRRMLSTLTV